MRSQHISQVTNACQMLRKDLASRSPPSLGGQVPARPQMLLATDPIPAERFDKPGHLSYIEASRLPWSE